MMTIVIKLEVNRIKILLSDAKENESFQVDKLSRYQVIAMLDEAI